VEPVSGVISAFPAHWYQETQMQCYALSAGQSCCKGSCPEGSTGVLRPLKESVNISCWILAHVLVWCARRPLSEI